jgi:hypothetical protein
MWSAVSFDGRPPFRPRGTGGGEAFEGVLADDVGGELVDRGEDVEREPSGRGAGVDVLAQHEQVDAALVEPGGDLGEVLD